MKEYRILPKYTSFPLGFRTCSLPVGIKPKSTKQDFALIASDHPCTVAAVFTKNKFRAAPVLVSQSLLQSQKPISSVLVNSGNANACTGPQGLSDAWDEAETVKSITGTYPFVLSTGVIGNPLPYTEKMKEVIPDLVKGLSSNMEAWAKAAEAFMTTDTFPKMRIREYSFPNGRSFRILGITKGAGMINPNMATLLSTFVTDAHIPRPMLQKALEDAVKASFNRISVDGDESTNDTCVILSNTQTPSLSNEEIEAFSNVLRELSVDLAKLIVRDGEGATKFVTVQTRNAPSEEVAESVCRAIVTSPLIKTALYGKDANWGRIVAKLGSVTGDFARENVSVYLGAGQVDDEDMSYAEDALQLVLNGEPYEIDESIASKILEETDVSIVIDLGCEEGCKDTMWTCDLSREYVSINADYRS